MSKLDVNEATWGRAQALAIKLTDAAGKQQSADMLAAMALLVAGQVIARANTKAEAEVTIDNVHEFARSLLDTMWESKKSS